MSVIACGVAVAPCSDHVPADPTNLQVGELPQPEAGCEVAPEAVVAALLEAGVLTAVDPEQLDLGAAGDDAAE